MKKLIGFAIAGALIAGYNTAAMAQALPSSDNADLWLFVSDQATGTTFAEDTGISINSLMPSGSLSSGSVLSTAISDSINQSADGALSSYISSNGASNLEWGIEAVQFNGTSLAKADDKQDAAVAITDNNGVASKTSGLVLANFETWGNDYQGDVNYLDGTYTSGGTVYKITPGSPSVNVWGAGDGNIGGSTNLYGQGAEQAGVGLGSSATLYGVTGNGGTGQLESYVLGTLELTATGTLETLGSNPTVPLPAPLWLFGSGLLGLAGIGRRRSLSA